MLPNPSSIYFIADSVVPAARSAASQDPGFKNVPEQIVFPPVLSASTSSFTVLFEDVKKTRVRAGVKHAFAGVMAEHAVVPEHVEDLIAVFKEVLGEIKGSLALFRWYEQIRNCQGLCENICNLIFGLHKLDLDFFLGNAFKDEMIPSSSSSWVEASTKGVEQSHRQVFQERGFKKCPHEHALYVKMNGKGNCLKMFDDFKKEMAKEFEMTNIGLMLYYLRIEVKQRDDGIFISQEAYAKEVLKRFNMKNCNPISISIEVEKKLSRQVKEGPIDRTLFRRLLGSLRYLTCTRPDILYLGNCVEVATRQDKPRRVERTEDRIELQRLELLEPAPETAGVTRVAQRNGHFSTSSTRVPLLRSQESTDHTTKLNGKKEIQ
ncbi:hypothetical protein RJ639_010271 [Escallonia herrerae]|uniref:Reverse transcriptase Ty1/copia-type domain-containing protein n=1 Tax=Escallonia herrerae TaxID=1293975 RepID=A0AA88VVI6_9ASTE|nr:hypothetical protein RJ639_010271 [Escallonia herrerae]